MEYAINNLGVSLDEFRREWEKNHLDNVAEGERCAHHGARFKAGWIPLATEPYLPALGNRFRGRNELAREIVGVLETKGEYDFSKNPHEIAELEEALTEIMGRPFRDIGFIIADGNAEELLLDRQAFTTGGDLIGVYVQWYIRKINPFVIRR